MPLPLVHLTVAHECLPQVIDRENGLDTPRYYLGAIAPDAIHMREGWTREDKRRVHLFADSKDLRARMEGEDDLNDALRETADASLLRGWISHLVTDALWSHYVMHSFWDFCCQDEPREVRRRVYYRENDKIEYQLFHEAPWKDEIWNELSIAVALPFGDYLSSDEIAAWRDRYLRWHREIGEEPEEMPQFFTLERTVAFAELATRACVAGFQASFSEALDAIGPQYPAGFIAGIDT